MNHKKNNKPQHISKVVENARKEWLKSRAQAYFDSPQFNVLNNSNAGLQVFFLYIEGDPQYIRTIFLN